MLRAPSKLPSPTKNWEASIKVRMRGLLERFGWSKPVEPSGTPIENLRQKLAETMLKARDNYRLEVNRDDVIELVRVQGAIVLPVRVENALAGKPYALKGIRVIRALAATINLSGAAQRQGPRQAPATVAGRARRTLVLFGLLLSGWT